MHKFLQSAARFLISVLAYSLVFCAPAFAEMFSREVGSQALGIGLAAIGFLMFEEDILEMLPFARNRQPPLP